jgi:glucan phosphoethanolaminetransferase (alkaline phosphatase superfamily)
MAPELLLYFRNHEDLKYFGPICYYEFIVSFVLLLPALIGNRTWSRFWVVSVGSVMALATIIVGFQAATIGARWDITAHSALMQTSSGEAAGFLRSFVSVGSLLWTVAIAGAFAGCIAANFRSALPRRPAAVAVVLACVAVSSYGLHNFFRYGRESFQAVPISNGQSLKIANVGMNKYHPVTLLLVTDHNYRVTHSYYLEAYKEVSGHIDEFKGGVTIPGAVAPRVVIVVIGESASRRHWSLYGYGRDTNPEVRKLGSEVLLFNDVISSSVGTQTVLRAMFSTNVFSIPAFPLFSLAGYKTHWISAQFNQGANDVEVAALVQSCEDRQFLDGAYDENLVPLVNRAVLTPGRQIVFVNLFGSHVRYEDRYPASFAVFHGENEKDHRLANYDNSILYTDHVLAGLIGVLRERHEASCFVYVSDHAEDVYDSNRDLYLFRSDAVATNAMYEVPFLVWFSPEFRQGNPGFVRDVAAARDRKYQTLAFYQTLIDLSRLRHPLYDPHMSLFSPDFVERKRRVGVMNRVYHKEQ